MKDLIDRFEAAVRANGPRTCDDATAKEYEESRKALADYLAETHGMRNDPEAFLVTKLDGTDRRIVDAAKYDPREPRHWTTEVARLNHIVTPLTPARRTVAPVEVYRIIKDVTIDKENVAFWSRRIAKSLSTPEE